MSVTEEEYRRVQAIVRRACAAQRPFLSAEDWEEVEQDAAVAAWRTGSATRTWWAAVNSATDHQHGRRVHKPVMVPLACDRPSTENVEDEVCGRLMADQLLSCLSDGDQAILVETVLLERTQQDVADEMGVNDGTVCRWRAGALERLRACLST